MTGLGIKATVAMAIALLLVVSARHSRASLRHLVLAALFLFLLLLPVVQHFAPAIDIPVQNPVVQAPAAEVMRGVELREMPAAAPGTERVEAVAPAGGMVSVHWRWRALQLYVAGAVLLLGWLAIGVFRLRRLADTAEVWLEGTARMNEIALEANIRRPALVVLSGDVAVPLTFGFRRSTIVLPEAAREWSGDELTRALRHELEHVRREDWFLQLAARAACALYWPHPFVWIAWRRFCLEAERACDDAVIGASSPEAYAGQLVALARHVQRMSSVPALAMASRSKLALRVAAILDGTQPRGPHGRSATLAACAVMLALLVSVAPARIVQAAAESNIAADDRVADGDHDTEAAVSEGVAGGIEDGVSDGIPEGIEGGIRDGVTSGVEDTLGEALVKAAEVGDVQDVKRLLEHGIDVNTVVDGDGTALLGAARGGQMHMVEYLLERGADVNLPARGDGSPLIAASRMGYVDIAKLLIGRGADVNLMVEGDENALMQAAWNGHADVVRLLISEGADVNSRAYEQGELRTPLILARRGKHDIVVQMLLRAGARE